MKMIGRCLFAILIWMPPVLAQEVLPVMTNFSGRIHTYSGFYRDDAFKEAHLLAKETVIRSTNEYNLFVGRLPALEPLNTKGNDHPNDDPLFRKPPIDFGKYMMVAVVRDNMYLAARITRVAVSNQNVIVEYTEEELGGWASCQQEGGLGMYCAVVFPKTGKLVQFKGTTTKSTQPEPASAGLEPAP